MSYKVIRFFHDLQDTVNTKCGKIYHAYNVGDTYPRKGYKPSEDRIAELAGKDNKQGVPLIQIIEESPEENNATETDNESAVTPQSENTKSAGSEEEEKPKRGRNPKESK